MKISSYAYTALTLASLASNAYAGCSTDKVNVEVCLKTDNYPHETKLTIDDDDDRMKTKNAKLRHEFTYGITSDPLTQFACAVSFSSALKSRCRVVRLIRCTSMFCIAVYRTHP